MKKNLSPVRGTNDYLPKEMLVREYVRSEILKTYKRYGFMQISAPILEDIDNLIGSDGGDNEKLIYKVLKRGEKLDHSKENLTEKDIVDIGLRYDLTVPMVRLFSGNQNALPKPFKSMQIDYSFRADRPQRGRSRQFIQCDIDILGDESVNAEIDIINTTAKTFLNLGFKDFVAKVNDRRILSALIANAGFEKSVEAEVCVVLDKLDKIGIDGVRAELLERGFGNETVEKLMSMVDAITNQGLEAVKNFGVSEEVYNSVQKVLDVANGLSGGQYKVVFDVTIVRGQGYYTGLVYEFYMDGFGGACAGGGRYDKMVEKMTGKAVPAVGLGFGFEPTCMLIMERNMINVQSNMVAVLYKPEDDFLEVLKYVEEINKTANASAVPQAKNVGFQLQTLKENGYTHFCNFFTKELKEI
jgi:histidyl-tRNA synthetase